LREDASPEAPFQSLPFDAIFRRDAVKAQPLQPAT
jgi:hypothetical protein